MRYTFEVVSHSVTRKWIDSEGKKRQQTRKFEQTINPFNRDPVTGLPKCREQITREIRASGEAWLKEQVAS
jgi:hypothetical protein